MPPGVGYGPSMGPDQTIGFNADPAQYFRALALQEQKRQQNDGSAGMFETIAKGQAQQMQTYWEQKRQEEAQRAQERAVQMQQAAAQQAHQDNFLRLSGGGPAQTPSPTQQYGGPVKDRAYWEQRQQEEAKAAHQRAMLNEQQAAQAARQQALQNQQGAQTQAYQDNFAGLISGSPPAQTGPVQDQAFWQRRQQEEAQAAQQRALAMEEEARQRAFRPQEPLGQGGLLGAPQPPSPTIDDVFRPPATTPSPTQQYGTPPQIDWEARRQEEAQKAEAFWRQRQQEEAQAAQQRALANLQDHRTNYQAGVDRATQGFNQRKALIDGGGGLASLSGVGSGMGTGTPQQVGAGPGGGGWELPPQYRQYASLLSGFSPQQQQQLIQTAEGYIANPASAPAQYQQYFNPQPQAPGLSSRSTPAPAGTRTQATGPRKASTVAQGPGKTLSSSQLLDSKVPNAQIGINQPRTISAQPGNRPIQYTPGGGQVSAQPVLGGGGLRAQPVLGGGQVRAQPTPFPSTNPIQSAQPVQNGAPPAPPVYDRNAQRYQRRQAADAFMPLNDPALANVGPAQRERVRNKRFKAAGGLKARIGGSGGARNTGGGSFGR